MSGTVDIRRALLAVMAAAALVVVLAVPMQAQAADDCAAAGTDPTAAQYCPPTEPEQECVEGTSGSNSGSGSENCDEEQPVALSEPPAPPSSTTPTASAGGTLPFTGADVIALLAVAAGFIAIGLALQRLSRSNAEHS